MTRQETLKAIATELKGVNDSMRTVAAKLKEINEQFKQRQVKKNFPK